MLRYRLLLIGLVALLCCAVVVIILRPGEAITPANAKYIQPGMTVAEVEELLGGAARNESNLPDDFPGNDFVEDNLGFGKEDNRRWISKRYVVIVSFDASGHVRKSDVFGVGNRPVSIEDLWDRIGRLVGL
jgi:hypothetical protein